MPLTPESGLLGDIAGVRDLYAAERAWFAALGDRGPAGARLWLAPPEGPAPDPGWIVLQACGGDAIGGLLRAQRSALPFADGSVARLVVQHALEHDSDCSAFLGDCARALMPGGELVLFCFDPLSLWHPWLLAQARRRGSGLHLRLGGRVGALVRRLGLADIRHQTVGARWPGARSGEASSAWGGLLRAAYAIAAVKRVASVIALRPRAVRSPMAANGLLPASQRVASSA